MKKSLLLFLTLVVTQLLFAQTIHYVQAGGTGDGSSWSNASGDLQAMINAAQSGDQVWVAAGTYTPTSGTDRTISFLLKNGVPIYGGFAGGETVLSQRNWQTNVTILSGDIGNLGDNSDNSFHVVNGNSTNSTAVLDGFTIKGGNAFTYDLTDVYRNGGGMYNNASSPTLSNCTFSGNIAQLTGGGMYNVNSSSPTLSNCTFLGNTAHENGGGMYNENSSSPNLTNCSFSGNTAYTNLGGGMYNESSSPTLTNCIFSGNTAENGGGMYNNASYPKLTNCTFSGNTTQTEPGGGGMFNQSSSPTLTNCLFSGNYSNWRGGGMLNLSSSSPTLTDCTFSGNSCFEFGGGMSNENSCNPKLINCSFSGNTIGGGMYNYASSPTLTKCTFSENSANVDGGGMLNQASSNPKLTNCSFLGNSASRGGGTANEFSNPTFINCTFSENSALFLGGGMDNYASAPTLTNCSFSANRTDYEGGGMHNENSSAPTLTNCILWGNPGGEIINEDGTPTVTYSIVQGGYSGIGNKDQSPLFVDSANGNLHLQPCSPAIDAGIDAANSTTTDLDGKQRKVRTIDMGAYEYQGALATATIADAKALNKGVDVNTVYIGYAPASSLTLQAGISGASGPFTYQWSTGATTPSITVSPTTNTTYTVTVSNGTCTGTASKQVKVVDVRCNPNNKVNVCHGGNTLCIDKTSVPDHLNHGDYLGACKTPGKNLIAGNDQALIQLSVQAAPNPSRSYFSLMIHTPNVKDKVTLRVMDAVGRTVEVRTISAGGTVQLGASYLQGTYFVQAVQAGSSVTVKLVKQ
jgi:parallel beta-helix repeat protein